jgi:hypothetical protein
MFAEPDRHADLLPWQCPQCQLHNVADVCSACATARPTSPRSTAPSAADATTPRSRAAADDRSLMERFFFNDRRSPLLRFPSGLGGGGGGAAGGSGAGGGAVDTATAPRDPYHDDMTALDFSEEIRGLGGRDDGIGGAGPPEGAVTCLRTCDAHLSSLSLSLSLHSSLSSLSLSLSLTHTHSLTHSLSHTHTHSLTHSLS